MENRSYERAILKGIRSLISELEDNDNLMKNSKKTKTEAWTSVRQESWFLPPIINEQVENHLKEIYRLLEDYNEELLAVMKANPKELGGVKQKYLTKYGLPSKILTAKTQIGEIAKKSSQSYGNRRLACALQSGNG